MMRKRRFDRPAYCNSVSVEIELPYRILVVHRAVPETDLFNNKSNVIPALA